MARNRKVLPHKVEAEIKSRTKRGESADIIFAALHGAASRSKIARLQKEIRDGTTPTPISAKTHDEPKTVAEDVPEEIPDNTPIEMIDRWIARVEKGASVAEAAGNLPALSSLAMRAASLAEARRRAMPTPKPDPNEDPDMVALAKQGEELIAKQIAGLFSP